MAGIEQQLVEGDLQGEVFLGRVVSCDSSVCHRSLLVVLAGRLHLQRKKSPVQKGHAPPVLRPLMQHLMQAVSWLNVLKY